MKIHHMKTESGNGYSLGVRFDDKETSRKDMALNWQRRRRYR